MKLVLNKTLVFSAGCVVGFVIAYEMSPANSQNILALAAVLTAVFAAITAYLNYESRPQLTKAMELHTSDHRELAKSFEFEILNLHPLVVSVDAYEDLIQFANGTWKPTHLAQEDQVLFTDIRNHDSTGILDKWKAWKAKESEYVTARSSVFNVIAAKLSAQLSSYTLCLNDTSLETAPRQLTRYAVGLVYGNLVSKAFKQRLDYYAPLLATNGGVQTLPDRAHYFVRDPSTLTLLYTDVQNSQTLQIDGDSIIETAHKVDTLRWVTEEDLRKIIAIRQQLESLKEELFRLLCDFERVPLLPGKCKFIEASGRL